MSLRRQILLGISIILLCCVTFASSYNDTLCEILIGEGRKNGAPWIYCDKDGSGKCLQTDKRFRMYLSQCPRLCGSWYTPYPPLDIIKRIALWLVPIFMVVGNFQFPPLGPLNSLCIAIHLFGDPITTVYSLLVKLEVSRRIHAHWVDSPPPIREGEFCENGNQRRRALRDIATVNALFDEWNYNAIGVYPQMRTIFDRLEGEKRRNFIAACREAAHKLSDLRVNDSLRTWLAVAGYIVCVVSAFLKTLESGASNRTAHTIAFAILYSWLIPAAVISASVGGFASTRAGRRVIKEIQDELQDDWKIADPADVTYLSLVRLPFSGGAALKDFTTLEESFSFFGSYSFRHNMNLKFPTPRTLETRRAHSWNRPNWLLLLLSCLPIFIATATALLLSTTHPPHGLGCRSLTEIIFSATWFLSALFTKFTSNFFTGKYHFRLVVAKDLIIAIMQVGFLVAAFVGYYNSCFCWSNYFSLTRRGPAFTEVIQSEVLKKMVRMKWPVIAAVGLSAQGLMLLIMCLCSARGLNIYHRSEVEQARMFGELNGHEKRITRKCSLTSSEMDYGRGRKGSETDNGKLFLAPVLMRLGTLGQ